MRRLDRRGGLRRWWSWLCSFKPCVRLLGRLREPRLAYELLLALIVTVIAERFIKGRRTINPPNDLEAWDVRAATFSANLSRCCADILNKRHLAGILRGGLLIKGIQPLDTLNGANTSGSKFAQLERCILLWQQDQHMETLFPFTAIIGLGRLVFQ